MSNGEPIIGWRYWLCKVSEELGGPLLCSPLYEQFWLPNERAVCKCDSCHHRVANSPGVPHIPRMGVCLNNSRHRAGFHTMSKSKDLDAIRHYSYFSPYNERRTRLVSGQVSLWGKVVECEKGYRGQYAYPYELFAPARLAPALRAAYSVDVVELPNG